MARRKTRPIEDRFWEKVQEAGDCWEWHGRRQPNGYGKFYVDGAMVMAHRWSYERFVAPIPAGLVIDHLCRNRACVRWDHLEPVTQKENLRRGVGVGAVVAAMSASKVACPQGHPYDESNTYKTKNGKRMCRTCCRIRAARRRAKEN